MSIDPYIKKEPNDLIRSGDWNDIQVRARQEIRSHTHKGGADGTQIPREGIQLNAIDGTRIDPASKVTVAQLKVVDRDLLVEINALINRANGIDQRLSGLDNRANALDAAKVNRAGDTITGALAISGGNLTVSNGAIVPKVGNSSSAGIQFPSDPGSGAGDQAFIRYFVATPGTEDTKLLIGIENDANDTLGLWQAGAERVTLRDGIVSVNTRLGIGTPAPAKPLHIQQGDIGAPVISEVRRPGLAISGEYPDLTIFSSVNNTRHGPALRLGAYDNDQRTSYKSWSIGTAGRNAAFLDIGFSVNDPNPHVGIDGWSGNGAGRTVLTCREDGNVGIGTRAPVKPLHIQQGDMGAPVISEARRPGLAISGEYPDLTIFSSVNNTSHGPTLRLGAYDNDQRTSYKSWSIGTAGRNAAFLDIGFSANEPNPHVGIDRWVGGGTGKTVLRCHESGKASVLGSLDVSGVITGAVTRPLREQLVHRRILYGYAGDAPFMFGVGWAILRPQVYGPFAYAVPAIQPGARRRFRVYCIFSDNIQIPGEQGHGIFVRLEAMSNPAHASEFFMGNTWGGLSYENRDAYSGWIEGAPFTEHGKLMIRTTVANTTGKVFFLELQTWDFF